MEPGGKTRTRVYLQFRKDGSHMVFDGANADVQGLTHFLVGQPACHGFRYLELAVTQSTVLACEGLSNTVS